MGARALREAAGEGDTAEREERNTCSCYGTADMETGYRAGEREPTHLNDGKYRDAKDALKI